MPKEFYVGQEVCCKHKGKGVVIKITELAETYPVKVKFHNGGRETYTADGKMRCWGEEPDLTPVQEKPVFIEGQRVWCVIFGEGLVSRLTDDPFPVVVEFLNGEEEPYTSTGHFFRRVGNQSLFPYPVKVSRDESVVTKPSINWSHVKGDYKWLSVDKDGSAYVYEDEPERSESDYWLSLNASLTEVNGLASYTPGTCDWQDSLIERPKN